MNKKRIRFLLIVLFSIGSLLYGFLDSSTEGTKRGDAPGANMLRVGRVFDGDTVSLLISGRTERVRLIGIDAPEMAQRPWGRRAKNHLEEIISGASGAVRFERDVVERDRYGRLLGYIRTPEGRLINEMMVRDGYAVLYTFPPNVKYVDLFTAAEKAARDRKLGIWGNRGLRQEPSEYRRQHPRKY